MQARELPLDVFWCLFLPDSAVQRARQSELIALNMAQTNMVWDFVGACKNDQYWGYNLILEKCDTVIGGRRKKKRETGFYQIWRTIILSLRRTWSDWLRVVVKWWPLMTYVALSLASDQTSSNYYLISDNRHGIIYVCDVWFAGLQPYGRTSTIQRMLAHVVVVAVVWALHVYNHMEKACMAIL